MYLTTTFVACSGVTSSGMQATPFMDSFARSFVSCQRDIVSLTPSITPKQCAACSAARSEEPVPSNVCTASLHSTTKSLPVTPFA